ncbi:hypothetical protein QQF64_031267, partial [Cirrhinus molitorella]
LINLFIVHFLASVFISRFFIFLPVTLIAIGQYSSTIETVDAGWCKEITDQGATQIAKSSKSLRYLGLMRCDKVNEETVERLVLQYPHIVFSTVMQDCKRTLERAYQMGWSPNTSTAS